MRSLTPLQRETVLPSSDRGRLAAIVATCSLAGLAGGMALSMLAETHRAVDATRVTDEELARLEAQPVTWLGVTSTDIANHQCAGAHVVAVEPNSPASRAGLAVDDVIVSFGGDHLCNSDTLVDVVRASEIGASPEIRVRRGAQDLVLHPVLGSMPNELKPRAFANR